MSRKRSDEQLKRAIAGLRETVVASGSGKVSDVRKSRITKAPVLSQTSLPPSEPSAIQPNEIRAGDGFEPSKLESNTSAPLQLESDETISDKESIPPPFDLLARFDAQPFSVPKKGNKESEYEDAFCLTKSSMATLHGIRFAVADGATEASFSRIWASQLVRAFVRGRIRFPFDLAQLRKIQNHWAKMVHRRPLPWYAEEKVQSGAFSSLIGLEFCEARDIGGSWRAIAIGDSCLIQMRKEQVVTGFPLSDSASFSNRVTLLSSNPTNNQDVPSVVRETGGTWNPGDTFFLMTDAVAAWFFKQVECKGHPWIDLRSIGGEGMVTSFSEWIDELRASCEMKNDDVTVLRIQVAG